MANKKKLIRYMLLRYGAIIGAFWIFKYLFLIGSGFSDHVFIYIYYLLNVGTFLLIYIFYFRIRSIAEGLWQCVKVMACICLIGSALEGILMFLHYQFIHPSYFYSEVTFIPRMIVESVIGKNKEDSFLIQLVSSKSFYIVGNIVFKIFIGTLLTTIIGIFSKNRQTEEKE